MSEWKTIPADVFCDSVRDGTHDTPKQVEKGYKLVTAKHIINGQIDLSDAYLISEQDYLKINERSKVEQWDVLMSMIGNGLGKSAVVKNMPEYAIKNLALFKLGNEIKAKWLHYYLSSKAGQGFIYNSLQGSGQPFISLSLLRKFPIPVPNDETIMDDVVNVLSRYDSLIENYQKQIKLLEEAAQRLYKEWFVDLHFPGHENTKIVDGVPEGWEKKRAIDFFDMSIGKTPPRAEKEWFSTSEKDVSWVSISDMKDVMFVNTTGEKLTQEACDKFNVKIVPEGTVLLSFKLTVGRVSIAGIPVCTNEAIAHFMGSGNSWREYTLLYLKNYHFDSLGNTSGISKAVNSTIIKNMPFLMPCNEILESFSKIVSPIFAKIKIASYQIRLLTEARDRLLPKLMSGEIAVEGGRPERPLSCQPNGNALGMETETNNRPIGAKD